MRKGKKKDNNSQSSSPSTSPTSSSPSPSSSSSTSAFPKEGRGKGSKLNFLTKEEYERALDLIRNGGTDAAVMRMLGIGGDTFYKWLRKGKANTAPQYKKFYEDVQQARAEAQVSAELAVKKMSPHFWLSHGPARRVWGHKVQMDHTVEDGPERRARLERQAMLKTIAQGLLIMEEMGFITISGKIAEVTQGEANNAVNALP